MNIRKEAAPLSSGSANESLDEPPTLRMVPSGIVAPAEQKTLLLTSRGRKELEANEYSSAYAVWENTIMEESR